MNRQRGEFVRRWVNRLHEGARRAVGLPERLVDHPPVTRRLRRVLEALADTIFPAGGAIPYSGRDAGVPEYMLNYLRTIPRQEGELFTLILLAYEHVLPKVLAKGWTFSDLPESKRAEMLHTLHETPIFPLRFLNISLRMFLSLGYLADERVMEEMGFYKRYAYEADPRAIKIRWWPLREESAQTLDTDAPADPPVEAKEQETVEAASADALAAAESVTDETDASTSVPEA